MKKCLKKILSTVLTAAMLVTSVVSVNTVGVYAAGITAKSAGWHETAYTEWLPVSGAASYEAYVKGTGSSSYVKLDDELIRQYNTYCRADAIGLAAGTYNMKIVAKNSAGSEIASYESGAISVDNFYRGGFAFSSGSFEKGTGIGGYKADGTPKDNAVILYINDENKNTITYDIITKDDGTTTTGTGLGPIMKLFEKGYETRPFIFRFEGEIAPPYSVDKFTLNVTDEEFHAGNNSSYRILDVKDNMKNSSTGGITFEGVGNDTVLHFNFNLTRAKSIEVRNLAFKDMTTKDEDGVTVTSTSSNYWVHNNDFFYGGQGSDNDQEKGDGCVDVKGTPDWGLVCDNHFWDTGKSLLCGLSETSDYHVTYARNWFDHSDSRHPRVRNGSIYVVNNYFDGNAKYGIGATCGASIFADSNYFRNCNDPVLSSKQGTDARGSGTFSGEAGGIIKMYGNILAGTKYTYIEGTVKASDGTKTYVQDADGYSVDSRDEQLPSSLVTLSGATSYNNFDTTIDTGISAADILDAKDVPAYVMANSGRCDGGNFTFAFTAANDDTDYHVNASLESELAAYKNQIITIGGTVTNTPNTSAASSSATGVDGNTSYQTRDNTYSSNAAALPTESQPEGNTATGGGTSGGTTEGGDIVVVGSDLVLNVSDVATGTYSSNVTGVGTNGAFDILANSSKTVAVDSSKGIQLGGAGSTTYRAIKVTTTQAGVVKVTSVSSGTDTRTLNVTDASGNVIGTIATGSSTVVTLPSAGTYYIYSAGSGINVKNVTVGYTTEGDDTTSGTESSSETTTAAQPSSETTTAVQPSSETTTAAEPSSETTTTAQPDDNDGYALEGTYIIGQSASGGDYNISTKVITEGNIHFNLGSMSTGGRIKTQEDNSYISFELYKPADVTITATSGRPDVNVRIFGETTVQAVFANGSSETYRLPAGSYVLESATPTSNAEITKIVVKYADSTGEDPIDPVVLKGDADGNGTVDKADVQMVLDFASGKITSVTRADLADVNGDGSVTAYDAYLIGKIILGLLV